MGGGVVEKYKNGPLLLKAVHIREEIEFTNQRGKCSEKFFIAFYINKVSLRGSKE